MNDWSVTYHGNLFEILQNEKGWEKASRAPGVRVILDDQVAGKILLTREFRTELNGYDFRLPGGKVFDSLAEYEAFRNTGADILEPATTKVIDEAREETGYDITNPKFINKSTLGATVDWDLYVFAATEFTKRDDGQRLEDGEQIETDLWFSYDEVRRMIMDGAMQEERIALALLRYLG
jgi:8-oxo-dGTP pyrophosphatase MutT (NUDIX family)